MKKINIFYVALIALILPVQQLLGQDVISAQELAKIYKSSDVVVVSTRTTSDYKKVHITGAVHINHSDLYKEGAVKNMLKSPAEIASILGAKGITEKKNIIIYDDGSGRYSGRLYWILDYLGAPSKKILDGHMDAWRAARKPVTKNPTSVKAATFTPKVDASKIATMDQVKKAMSSSSVVMVDARSAAEYAGTSADGTKGHIPNAINLEYTNMLDGKKKFKSADELAKLFKSKGITKDKEVIVYCESGVRAGILYMTLKSILGYPNVKVYDGALLEWKSNSANKLQT
jgi:thiosulfate/3-mercaptopyruvate sulfurtransferase